MENNPIVELQAKLVRIKLFCVLFFLYCYCVSRELFFAFSLVFLCLVFLLSKSILYCYVA